MISEHKLIIAKLQDQESQLKWKIVRQVLTFMINFLQAKELIKDKQKSRD